MAAETPVQNSDPTRVASWLERILALRDAPEWGPDEMPIEVVQTHISVVFLGRHHVLKLKKPVDFGFLDYTTLEKRLAACHAEVELNSRLCPGIYLGVRPVAIVDDLPHLGARGRIMDYGVWMRRLPARAMLDRLVATGAVTEAIIDSVGARLEAFHRSARRGPDVDAGGSVTVIRRNWDENFSQVRAYVSSTVSPDEVSVVSRYVDGWLASHHALLGERVRGGYICDGHGDVRCESVCIEDDVLIFDCIEFNERFRFGDVAGEVAFLAMDLAARGRPDLGYFLCERYEARSRDRELFSLLPFYRCYRAFVRGKVLSLQAGENEIETHERDVAAARAHTYFDLARRYASPLKEPSVVVVCGLSGTGKTSVARAIGQELGLRVVSADAVRKTIFADTRDAGYGVGPYGPTANRATYEAVVDEGRRVLRDEGGVILDATFRRRADRAAARAMAATEMAAFRLVECRLPEEANRRRLERRSAIGEGLSDATWETNVRQRDEFEAVETSEETPHLVLETDKKISMCGAETCDWLRAEDPDPRRVVGYLTS